METTVRFYNPICFVELVNLKDSASVKPRGLFLGGEKIKDTSTEDQEGTVFPDVDQENAGSPSTNEFVSDAFQTHEEGMYRVKQRMSDNDDVMRIRKTFVCNQIFCQL